MKDHCCETWRSRWEKEFDLSKEIDYHLSTRKPLYDLLDRCIASFNGFSKLRILELGCGTAIDSCILAQRNKGPQFFCFDLFHNSLKLAKEIGKKFNASLVFLSSDANNISFKDESFDLIFSQGVLEHFHDISLAVKEQVRLLKNGGILIIDVPQTYTLCTIVKQGRIKKGTWPYGWETQFSYRDLVSLGREFGLEAIDVCGHEYDSHIRFFNFVLWRNIIKRFQKVNPLRKLEFFKKIELGYDNLWNFLEKKWGHYFLLNIAVAFKKKEVE